MGIAGGAFRVVAPTLMAGPVGDPTIEYYWELEFYDSPEKIQQYRGGKLTPEAQREEWEGVKRARWIPTDQTRNAHAFEFKRGEKCYVFTRVYDHLKRKYGLPVRRAYVFGTDAKLVWLQPAFEVTLVGHENGRPTLNVYRFPGQAQPVPASKNFVSSMERWLARL